MRKGGGKAKGGAYELTLAKKFSAALSEFGVCEDDCYRTKNSGATKSQPGDLQLSPALFRLLPATIEAKHYRTISYKLGRSLSAQPKSYQIRDWWIQTKKEEKDSAKVGKPKFGLLVMRENNCPDLCAFSPSQLQKVFSKLNMRSIGFTRYTFSQLVVTHFHEEVWIVRLSEFLEKYALHLKWFTLFDEIDFLKG